MTRAGAGATDLLKLSEVERRLRIVGQTDADLFLWVYQRRRALRVLGPDADFDAAARDARSQKVSRRFRRNFLREKSHPLGTRSR